MIDADALKEYHLFMRKLSFFVSVMLLGVFTTCLAETVVLRSGKVIEGQMVRMSADTITLEVFGVPATYNLADVESIDGKSVVVPPRLNAPPPAASAIQESPSPTPVISESKQPPVQAIASATPKNKKKPSSKKVSEEKQPPQKIEIPETPPPQSTANSRNLDDAKAYFEIGYIHQSLGEDKLAAESYKKALAIDPHLGQKFFNDATDDYYLENYNDARDEFMRARALFEVQDDLRMVQVVEEQLRKFFQPKVPEPVDEEIEPRFIEH